MQTYVYTVPTERTDVHIVPTKWTYVHVVGVTIMNSSYCFNMSLCNNNENNETNISFYNILLNACAKGTCLIGKKNILHSPEADRIINRVYIDPVL